MVKFSVISTFLAGLIGCQVALAAPATPADLSVHSASDPHVEALEWLQKMGTAIREESYHGTFIYMRGARFDTVEVTHQFQDGKEFERLKNLSGAKREIVRHDDHAVCLHADGESMAPHPLPRGPFTHTFNRILAENIENYDFSVHGVGRIANRPAVRVSISPKNRDRYGYQLWLDEETGLLLRSNLVNRGRVLELFQFTEVVIGETLDPELLVASIDASGATTHELLTPGQLAELNQPIAPTWKVNWMPQGFRQVKTPNGEGMVFTDGVATLSVFVEKRSRNTLGEMQTQVGGTVVLSKPIEGSQDHITVIGEVPFATAKRVAESVEPVIY
ncbi:MAG: MucB/RseB C-terminal domain-containing protein [Pseudomonadales bacterium]|jgi:sigma-E factor negative regulatory protein RseB